MDPLAVFIPATRAWFERTFDAPTPAQAHGWPAIATGEHTLIQAPTGSGKTLAAFLYGIDRLTAQPGRGPAPALRVAAEGAELRRRAQPARPARRPRQPSSASPSAPATRRRRSGAMLRKPPDILITTPESLFLLLTSRGARDAAGGRDADPRRGARRRRHEARRPPRPLRRAARAPARRAVQRIGALGDAAPAGGDRPLRLGRPRRSSSSTRAAQGARPPGRRPRRGHARARPPTSELTDRARRPAAMDAAPSRSRSGRRSTRSSSSSSRRTARRSSSSTTAASPSGSRCG